jgi:hypothetical protein
MDSSTGIDKVGERLKKNDPSNLRLTDLKIPLILSDG